MIEVQSLTKNFGGRAILRGVSLRVSPGEAVALIGPSGGGKSTLLRCLNGLESFDAGQVRIADHQLHGGVTPAPRALRPLRQQVGMVFQQFHLFGHRTARDNVTEALIHVRGEETSRANARALEVLTRVGLAHRLDAYPHELSGGEQQRVALARALAMEPRVLLMDEPTSALDPERVSDVVELLRGLRDGGLTLVMVTHEMKVVRKLATRTVVLHGGELIEQGAPEEVLERPRDPRTRAFLALA
ncbi:MAG: amino acid ABC transporter ATP-binding protein [Myxococcota bacterium]